MQLILASASPRRRELLRAAGYTFDVRPPDIDEDTPAARMPPADLALYLARAKALDVSKQFPNHVTLAADTVVALCNRSLGKPRDANDARAMILTLTGIPHDVVTGVAVSRPALALEQFIRVTSTVRMSPLTPAQLDRYLQSGLWRGKAGAYGIQDPNPIVTRLTGSLTNVIGLPMEETATLLAQAGIFPHPHSQ